MSRRLVAVGAALAVHAVLLLCVPHGSPRPGPPPGPRPVRVELVGPEAARRSEPGPSPPTRLPEARAPERARRKVAPDARRRPEAPPAPAREARASATAPPAAVPEAAAGAGPAGEPRASAAPEPAARGLVRARPDYKRNPEPSYPREARRRRQQGTVLLSVRVSAAGRADSIAVAASSGFGALDAAAVAAVREWEFEPGRLDGEPVASQVEIPIRFELE